eukprot:579382-Rhodomonas_salina.2
MQVRRQLERNRVRRQRRFQCILHGVVGFGRWWYRVEEEELQGRERGLGCALEGAESEGEGEEDREKKEGRSRGVEEREGHVSEGKGRKRREDVRRTRRKAARW